jgi:polar amino acid transport system ATP-binding protein
MIQAQQVCKNFGRTAVLCGIDLRVETGEVMCIIGPSGSGKSTLLRCINHLEKIDAGRIYVNGHLVGYQQDGDRLRELRPHEVAAQRRDIGMVFQHFNLFPHMTVLANVTEAPIQVRKEPKDLATEQAHKLLHRVGLADKTTCYPAQLSGGQRQRVAIARALAMRPHLMLFDEPTSALDPELAGEVLVVIRGLAAEGMTMVIVTHEMGFAREVADSLAFIDQGAVVEQGTPIQVLTDPQHPRTREFLARVC